MPAPLTLPSGLCGSPPAAAAANGKARRPETEGFDAVLAAIAGLPSLLSGLATLPCDVGAPVGEPVDGAIAGACTPSADGPAGDATTAPAALTGDPAVAWIGDVVAARTALPDVPVEPLAVDGPVVGATDGTAQVAPEQVAPVDVVDLTPLEVVSGATSTDAVRATAPGERRATPAIPAVPAHEGAATDGAARRAVPATPAVPVAPGRARTRPDGPPVDRRPDVAPPGAVDAPARPAAPAAAAAAPEPGGAPPTVGATGAVGSSPAAPAPAVQDAPARTEPTTVTPRTLPAAIATAAQRLRQHGDGSYRLVVRLDPPELGSVRVDLTARGEELRVVLHVDHDGAGDALAQRRDDVARLLERSGFTLGGFDVRGGDGGARHDQQARRAHGRTAPTHDEDVDVDDPTTAAPATALRL